MRCVGLFLVVVGLLSSSESMALSQPADDAQSSARTSLLAGPMGVFVPRVGMTSYGDKDDVTKGGGGPHIGVQIQPLIHTSHPLRHAYLDIHAGTNLGDFSESQHKGIEIGASFLAWERQPRLFRFGINVGLSIDRWDVFDDNFELPQGNATSLSAALRPAVRLWRLELSMPIVIGRTLGSRDDENGLGNQKVQFWGLDLGLAL